MNFLQKFLSNENGNFAITGAVALVPIMGAVALAIDYTELTRHKNVTLNAMDAAGFGAARQLVSGATVDEAKVYANDLFNANLGSVPVENTKLSFEFVEGPSGGDLLKLTAKVNYDPYFLPVFNAMRGKKSGDGKITIDANFQTTIKLKNTTEIAFVLDNSGSMDVKGAGTSTPRLDLLKTAVKDLVKKISDDAKRIKRVSKPVQFSLVPFASSVNVGSGNSGKSWIDKDGLSSIHHENFDWTTLTDPNKTFEIVGGVHLKKGSGWGAEEGEKLTRFSLFDDMQRITGQKKIVSTHRECVKYRNNGTCTKWKNVDVTTWEDVYGSYASWEGCVESRPYPWNIDDTPPTSLKPDTLFVPMFAPDEADGVNAPNSWWADRGNGSMSSAQIQADMTKYFEPAPQGTPTDASKLGKSGYTGPNYSCTTQPITPLTDTTTLAGKKAIDDAVDAMVANGGTNVTEGIAWGRRTLSRDEPFTEGRVDADRGNDKVIIVLTDGRNTYYTPGSLGYKDLGVNKSLYSAYGYTKTGYGFKPKTRLFLGTSNDVSNAYSNSNYTTAMNEHMAAACDSAKDGEILIFAVGLDLDPKDDKDMIEALGDCASYSRSNKTKKLFWNTTGDDLDDVFRAITDELSNLRLVS